MKSTFGQFYPKSVQVAEAALAIPVSNAWPERGASQLKLIKTRIRSQIKNDLLASLLHVAINGPVPHTEACDSLVSKAVGMWKAAKKRRKLPHHRPSTQPQANSETESCHSHHGRTRYGDADRCNINHRAAEHPRGV